MGDGGTPEPPLELIAASHAELAASGGLREMEGTIASIKVQTGPDGSITTQNTYALSDGVKVVESKTLDPDGAVLSSWASKEVIKQTIETPEAADAVPDGPNGGAQNDDVHKNLPSPAGGEGTEGGEVKDTADEVRDEL